MGGQANFSGRVVRGGGGDPPLPSETLVVVFSKKCNILKNKFLKDLSTLTQYKKFHAVRLLS